MSDLIRREDAIDAIGADIDEIDALDPSAGIKKACIRRAIWKVMGVPSADRPQGEWIRNRYWSRGVGMGEEYGFFYKCSMCEYEVESGYTRCGFNYCPNCGAKMKGADDEV